MVNKVFDISIKKNGYDKFFHYNKKDWILHSYRDYKWFTNNLSKKKYVKYVNYYSIHCIRLVITYKNK